MFGNIKNQHEKQLVNLLKMKATTEVEKIVVRLYCAKPFKNVYSVRNVSTKQVNNLQLKLDIFSKLK